VTKGTTSRETHSSGQAYLKCEGFPWLHPVIASGFTAFEETFVSDIEIAVDYYGHLIPGANEVAVDRLDNATSRNLTATRGGRV
jgi:hypothetical protein